MNKIIKISNLKEGETFIYKGVLYEVWRKQKMNTFNKMISPIETHPLYKTNYKAGDIYKDQLWQLILDFKDGVRIDKEKPFNKLKKVID